MYIIIVSRMRTYSDIKTILERLKPKWYENGCSHTQATFFYYETIMALDSPFIKNY